MLLALGIALACGCAGDDDRPGPMTGTRAGAGGAATSGSGAAGISGGQCVESISCRGDIEVTRTCNGNKPSDSERDCAAMSQSCQTNLGCGVCRPGIGRCDGDRAERCNAAGTAYEMVTTCDSAAGEVCVETTASCENLCERAKTSNSYIGCEYWPAALLNSQVEPEFEFAAVVANPQRVPAQIRVTLGTRQITMVDVPPSQLRAIKLPWLAALKGGSQMERSALQSPGAYRLTSNVPVTVYQFNPLEYRLDHDCEGERSDPNGEIDDQCFSYSNDASLLLPTHVLTGDYMVVSRATMLQRIEFASGPLGQPQVAAIKSPGFFAVIGTEEGDTAVEITVKSHVEAAMDGSVMELAPGARATFNLAQGAVLQVVAKAPTTCTPGPSDQAVDPATGQVLERRTYCQVGNDYDLTGSEVHASGKVAVISGHNCGFVPYQRWACDHHEEALFPLQAWGKDYTVAITEPLRQEPNVIRVVSGADGNRIRFEPSMGNDWVLNRGEFREFETHSDFRITGSEALLVAQFLVGQDYEGIGTAGDMGLGDPSLSLAVPTEQFRRQYSVLAPETFPLNYLNVIAHEGSMVKIDGDVVSGFRPIPGTGMVTARVKVKPGPHELESTDFFGVVSYGFGTYTSYMVPAGLDLAPINVVD